jgi:hypothetical protein
MGCIWNFCERSEVVEPVKMRLAGDGVNAAKQTVDAVWIS